MLPSSSSRPPMWRRLQSTNRGSALTTAQARPPSVLLGRYNRRRTTTTRAQSSGNNANSGNSGNSGNSSASTARRLLDAALLDPLHDLSVDFDRTYLTHRCGQSVPLFSDGGAGGAATTTPGDATDSAATTNARLDRCLLLQREYGAALKRLLAEGGGDAGSAALDAAVLLSAFVLSAGDDDDEGDANTASPDVLLREARAAVDWLAERAIAIARGDRSARGLSAAVSEALFGSGGGGGDGSLALSSADASDNGSRCFYDPSNSCALEVLRRIFARHGTSSATTAEQRQQSLGSPAALALIWSAVASKAGLPSAPLPLPSHTFVRLWAASDEASSTFSSLPWLVDPYNSGQVCTAGVVSARLGRNWGVALDDDGGGDHQTDHHHPRTLHALALVRLLCNLRESSWAPLPLTGRVRWAPVVRGSGDGGGGGGGNNGNNNNKRSSSSSSRRTLWPSSSSSPTAAHDAVAARLAVRARKGWMGGVPSPHPPPPLAPLSARCVRAVRLLRVTLREMIVLSETDDRHHHQQQQQKQQLEAALPRLDRDEGYALCCGGMLIEGKEALRAYVEQRPDASDAAAVREFL